MVESFNFSNALSKPFLSAVGFSDIILSFCSRLRPDAFFVRVFRYVNADFFSISCLVFCSRLRPHAFDFPEPWALPRLFSTPISLGLSLSFPVLSQRRLPCVYLFFLFCYRSLRPWDAQLFRCQVYFELSPSFQFFFFFIILYFEALRCVNKAERRSEGNGQQITCLFSFLSSCSALLPIGSAYIESIIW